MVDMPHAGWYLLAFIDELTPGLNPVDVGPHALIAIRDGQDVRVFDGRCPHRGAHLGFGGVLDRGCVICPFHAKAIRLGEPDRRLGVRQHPVAQAGAAVFVRIGSEPAHDRGFEMAIKQIEASYQVLPATRSVTNVPPEMVVENAFDVDHFFAVHKVPRMHGMDVSVGDSGDRWRTNRPRSRHEWVTNTCAFQNRNDGDTIGESSVASGPRAGPSLPALHPG